MGPEGVRAEERGIICHAHRTWFDEAPSMGAKSNRVSYGLQFKIKNAAALKGYEHRTANAQRRILNKVFRLFLQFINRRSEAISSFDVQRSMSDVGRSKNGLIHRYGVYLFSPER
jgi:hypothetical protein